jgi:hypothetical protein
MSEIITVGLDLAKNVFQAHGADTLGRAVARTQSLAHAGTSPGRRSRPRPTDGRGGADERRRRPDHNFCRVVWRGEAMAEGRRSVCSSNCSRSAPALCITPTPSFSCWPGLRSPA